MGKSSFTAMLAAAFGGALSASPPAPVLAAAVEPVDVELVIATDVSPSIDFSEAQLQREGIAEAFLNPQVVRAIEAGSLGKIAVAAIDFSAREYNKIVVNWQIVRDSATATAFSQAIRKAPPSFGRHTSISDAIELAQLMLESNAIEGTRKVIDISGDGPNNWGRQVNLVRDAAVAKGIAINGLPILGSAPELDKYFADCVIGGRAAFIVVANGFTDFARAIRNKLIQEIAGADPKGEERPLLVKVAAAPEIGPAPRFGYRPPLNETGCENRFGGFGPFRGFDFPPLR